MQALSIVGRSLPMSFRTVDRRYQIIATLKLDVLW